MAADIVFLDTGVLLAASVELHPNHQAAMAYLSDVAARRRPMCISRQVCREFLVVLTREPVAGRTFTAEEVIASLEFWTSICTVLDDDRFVHDELLRLAERHEVRGKAVHDCNIVATMITYAVKHLATRNASDFERYKTEIAVEAVP